MTMPTSQVGRNELRWWAYRQFRWQIQNKKLFTMHLMKSQPIDFQGYVPRHEDHGPSPFPLTTLPVIHQFSQQCKAPVVKSGCQVPPSDLETYRETRESGVGSRESGVGSRESGLRASTSSLDPQSLYRRPHSLKCEHDSRPSAITVRYR
jgi:hypothetical protein